jgi:twitching motility protein PilT
MKPPSEPVLPALLAQCIAEGASDLHLAPGQPALLRVHGELVRRGAAMSPAEVEACVGPLLAEGGERAAATLAATGSVDAAITGPGGVRFRVNVFRTLPGVAIAVRRLEDRFRTLGELGLPESLYGLCDLSDGLVVVAGPTGSGKSTTLAALLDRINTTRDVHVVTIEDPIEYVHASQRALVNQRQVGLHCTDFAAAMVASLREDPDVVLLGEVRDLDTIRTAIRAAETGHLVFTTVHAGDCVGALERMVSVFPADEQVGIRCQLGLVLRAVVAQHLVTKDGPAAQRAAGRVVASEVLRMTPAIAHQLAIGRSRQIYGAIETGGQHGMQTLEQDLARLVHAGFLRESTARLLARAPEGLVERGAMLRRIRGDAP